MIFFFFFLFLSKVWGQDVLATKGFQSFSHSLPDATKSDSSSITVIVGNVGATRKGDERLRVLHKNVALSFFDYEKIPQSILTMAVNNGHCLFLTLSVPVPLEGLSNPTAFREAVDSERLADWQKLGPTFKGILLSHGYYGDEKTLKPILDYAAQNNQTVVFPEPQMDIKKICDQAKATCVVGHVLVTQKDTQEQLEKKLKKAEDLSKIFGHIILTVHANDILFEHVRQWLESLKEKNITLQTFSTN
jgi:polysaccharide deacetylase 2 family uncharacterized protein YibQ